MKRSQGYSALSGQKMERIHFQVVLCVKSNDKSRGVGRYREGTQCKYGGEVVHKIANIVLEITDTLSFLIDLAVERDHFVFHSRRHDPRV
jgi:hypothetical protein